MATSTYAPEPTTGFMGLFEGAALGIAAGWWLAAHYLQPVAYIGGGVAVTALYMTLIAFCKRSGFVLPILLMSLALWCTMGWIMGGYAYVWIGSPLLQIKLFANPVAWKFTGALVMGALALGEGSSSRRMGHA